jgi:iron complex outermembrane receptor protein
MKAGSVLSRLTTVSLLSLLLIGGGVGTGWSEDANNTVHELEEVVVTATNKMKVLDTPASISIITAEELEQMGANNIIEALRKIPGVDDTSAKDSAITIRGNRSAMAGGPVILIDGIPQKVGDYQYDEFSFIPVSQIERIEVLRSAGIAYGPGASRGVINIISKKGAADRAFGFDGGASYGSWNTHNEYAGISGGKNSWDYYFNATNYHTDGYEDEETDRNSALFRLGYTIPDGPRIGFKGNFMKRESDFAYGFKKKDWHLDNYRDKSHFPVSATDPTLWWHTEKEQEESTLALELSQRTGSYFYDASLSWTGYDEDYRDLHNLQVKPKSIYHDDKNQDTYAMAASGGCHLDFGQVSYTPTVGVNFEQMKFDQTRAYTNDPGKNTDKYDFDIDQKQYGLFWDNDFLFAGQWGLKAGGRVDRVEVEFEDKVPTRVDESTTMFSWIIAPSYHFSGKGSVYVSAARNYWYPTPRYYAWAAEKGGDINRPEDLKPEESITYEIGYKHMVSDMLTINLTTYYAFYNDKFSMVYAPGSTKSKGLKNVGDAEAKGIEVEVDGRLNQYVGYRFSGTLQDIEWTSGEMSVYMHPSDKKELKELDGYQIYDIPEMSYVFGLDFYPLEGLKLSADVNYTGSKYVDYLNRIKYDNKTTLDLYLSYTRNNWRYWISGKNVFDEEIERVSNSTGNLTGPDGEYDNAYYVQDGAYVEAGVSYRF